jgi:hypothetical protein
MSGCLLMKLLLNKLLLLILQNKTSRINLKIKTRLLVRKRVRFIESKQPTRLDDGTEAYENRTNSSWRNYILIHSFENVILNFLPARLAGGVSGSQLITDPEKNSG